MKIDKIVVVEITPNKYYWLAYYKRGVSSFEVCYAKGKYRAIAEARYLAKKLGCKLELPK